MLVLPLYALLGRILIAISFVLWLRLWNYLFQSKKPFDFPFFLFILTHISHNHKWVPKDSKNGAMCRSTSGMQLASPLYAVTEPHHFVKVGIPSPPGGVPPQPRAAGPGWRPPWTRRRGTPYCILATCSRRSLTSNTTALLDKGRVLIISHSKIWRDRKSVV